MPDLEHPELGGGGPARWQQAAYRAYLFWWGCYALPDQPGLRGDLFRLYNRATGRIAAMFWRWAHRGKGGS
jgi:hypothetical protein